MRPILFSFLLMGLLFFSACKNDDASGSDALGAGWSISQSEVLNGGPGKDGIPSVDNPIFVDVAEVEPYLRDDHLVVGIKVGDEVKAYPHPILDWHEIVNDEVGGEPIALTYCPLTGSALAWSRRLSVGVTTFGVSGLLYQTNLIPYDRETDSNWSQMLMQSVQGQLRDEEPALFPIVETSWASWQKMYPNTKVLSTNTGTTRNYGSYPYGDYRTANWLLFNVNPRDERLNLKERVHGLRIDNQVKVYRFGSFNEGTRLVNDQFMGKDVVVVGSEADNYIVSFNRRLESGEVLEFTAVPDALPIVMTDQSGSNWNIFGEAVDGPKAGTQLGFESSLIGYWLTFGSFYPQPAIFEF
ncbi:MAG: DUF3179 domain-containing protein [Bacteroidota bacterium]